MRSLSTPQLILLCGLWCLLAFGVIAYGVFSGQQIVQFDEIQAEKLYGIGQKYSVVLKYFLVITQFGGQPILNYVAGGIVLLLALRRQFSLALIFAVGALLNRELNIELKEAFARLRPIYTPPEIRSVAWGFPSGHAQSSMFIYGFGIYFIFLTLHHWTRWLFGSLLMLLILAVGISRMILGVHFFTDVLCGFLMAMAFLSPWIAGIEMMRGRGRVG